MTPMLYTLEGDVYLGRCAEYSDFKHMLDAFSLDTDEVYMTTEEGSPFIKEHEWTSTYNSGE